MKLPTWGGLLFTRSITVSLIGLIVFIVVVGLVVWLVNTYLPLPPPFKTIILVVAIIVVVIVVLRALGVWGDVNTSVPQVR